eukprot:scaffold63616_cov60-Phaeocystis_antarctica.AAC.4
MPGVCGETRDTSVERVWCELGIAIRLSFTLYTIYEADLPGDSQYTPSKFYCRRESRTTPFTTRTPFICRTRLGRLLLLEDPVESLNLLLERLLDVLDLLDLYRVLHKLEQVLLDLEGRPVNFHDLVELSAGGCLAVHQLALRGALDRALVCELALVGTNIDVGVTGLLELHEVDRNCRFTPRGARGVERELVRLGDPAVSREIENLQFRRAALADTRGNRQRAIALNFVAVKEELLQRRSPAQLLGQRLRLRVAPAELAKEQRLCRGERQLVQPVHV